ncbi:alpha/beta hydrolase [Pseudonocardia kunmingensis]|uniref:Pimeloyl-ACP methyl ester carboxylesterase n=1 Tax=Pseudonocardia kunmingensis TaxID=630975 RepID=A0A543CXC5_9PSEU|nr:alpha/beta hydrolase [Pseudonocardia kunmingensis]TQM01689.1 pimeloyl-ACP methyl ester carboxylesterase [Pseudonocardia kunmingensis]
MPPAPTYVLVHGSGSSSFLWAPVQRELALLGARSYAVDLPGHGLLDAQYPVAYQAPQDLEAWAKEPATLADVTLEDNVNCVLHAVRRLAEHGPVVLVAASLGGMTISVAANRAPDLVDGLVYISAWSCVELPNPIAYMSEAEFSVSEIDIDDPGGLSRLNVGDPAQLGVGRANYRTSDRALLAALKDAVMAEATDEQFLSFLNTLQPDESLAVMTGDSRVDAATWGRIPHTYIRLLNDRSLPVAVQDRLIAEANALTPGNPFTVHTLESSHVGFVLQAERTAALITDSLQPRTQPVPT